MPGGYSHGRNWAEQPLTEADVCNAFAPRLQGRAAANDHGGVGADKQRILNNESSARRVVRNRFLAGSHQHWHRIRVLR